MLSAPKGREISAQGFNPGLVDRIRRALKVAPEEASLGHRYANSIGCRKSGASFPPSLAYAELRRTGRAHDSFTSNPGLKPWAKLCRPFGAETATALYNP
jgi:hypothetical protein